MCVDVKCIGLEGFISCLKKYMRNKKIKEFTEVFIIIIMLCNLN